MVECGLADIGCQVSQTFINVLLPYVIPIVILLVALLVLPRFGPKGALLALIVIIGEFLWFFGIPGSLPPLKDWIVGALSSPI